MIYNTMTLGGVPWETIIKHYRRQLGRRSFATLEEYCTDFMRFIGNDKTLFTPERQAAVLTIVAARILFECISDVKRSVSDLHQKLTDLVQDLEREERSEDLPDAFEDRILSVYGNDIDAASHVVLGDTDLSDLAHLCRRVVALRLTRKRPLGGYTGIVFAGFGRDDVFPSMREYVVDLIIDNHIKKKDGRTVSLDVFNSSKVVAFAEEDSVRTIMEGVNPSYGKDFFRQALELFGGLPEKILGSIEELSNDQRVAYAKDAKETAIEEFISFIRTMNDIRERQYTQPIERAISVMPLAELATVAEVFVNLAQIRQRMSLETETVGGPIDVAVISKGDGFVWIKRKHYFDGHLNPIFVERYFDEGI